MIQTDKHNLNHFFFWHFFFSFCIFTLVSSFSTQSAILYSGFSSPQTSNFHQFSCPYSSLQSIACLHLYFIRNEHYSQKDKKLYAFYKVPILFCLSVSAHQILRLIILLKGRQILEINVQSLSCSRWDGL